MVPTKKSDIHDPKGIRTPPVLPEERKWMDTFLANGWIDTFRQLNPPSAGAYSGGITISYGAFTKAKDGRIDYV
jgi:exodeoxyribonuclease-3